MVLGRQVMVWECLNRITFKPFAQTMLDLLTDENGVLLDEAAKKAYQNYGY